MEPHALPAHVEVSEQTTLHQPHPDHEWDSRYTYHVLCVLASSALVALLCRVAQQTYGYVYVV